MSGALLHKFLMESKAFSNIFTQQGFLESIEYEGDIIVPGDEDQEQT